MTRVCPTCQGTKRVTIRELSAPAKPCATCDGKGLILPLLPTEKPTVKLIASDIELLRAMRLYHWRKIMFHRREAERQINKGKGKERWAEASNQKANAHARYVVTLNAFFPTGDIAERDDVTFESRYRVIGQ